MSGLVFLIPIALLMGLTGLAAFIWAVRSGQFDDPDGAAHRRGGSFRPARWPGQ